MTVGMPLDRCARRLWDDGFGSLEHQDQARFICLLEGSFPAEWPGGRSDFLLATTRALSSAGSAPVHSHLEDRQKMGSGNCIRLGPVCNLQDH